MLADAADGDPVHIELVSSQPVALAVTRNRLFVILRREKGYRCDNNLTAVYVAVGG